jgi:hypothetical protein
MSSRYLTTIIDLGYINNKLHYGPFASYWWFLKTDPNTKLPKYYPIRLNLKTKYSFKDITFEFFIDIESNNQPKYICSTENFISTSSEMTTAVNETYSKYLQSKDSKSKTKLPGPNFFGMANNDQLEQISKDINFFPFTIEEGNLKYFIINCNSENYDITFNYRYLKQTVIILQSYKKEFYHIKIYSIENGNQINKFKDIDPNLVWNKLELFKQKGKEISGKKLFLLNNEIILNNLKNPPPKLIVSYSDWNEDIYNQLYLAYAKHITKKEDLILIFQYLKNKKSTLFEFWDLFQNKFQIIEKNNNSENIKKKIRGWKQILKASGCQKIKEFNNKEVIVFFNFF